MALTFHVRTSTGVDVVDCTVLDEDTHSVLVKVVNALGNEGVYLQKLHRIERFDEFGMNVRFWPEEVDELIGQFEVVRMMLTNDVSLLTSHALERLKHMEELWGNTLLSQEEGANRQKVESTVESIRQQQRALASGATASDIPIVREVMHFLDKVKQLCLAARKNAGSVEASAD